MEFEQTSPGPAPEFLCALQQHPHYAATLKQMGTDVQSFKVKDAGNTLARLQIVERKLGPVSLRWLPRGPVWSSHVTAQQKSEMLRLFPDQFRNSAIWISALEDDSQSDLFRQLGHRDILTPQHVAEIDLTRSENSRLRDQKGKWRNRLRHAQKAGLTIRQRKYNPRQDAHLIALETAQRRDRRYSALPATFLDAWTTVNKGAARIFLAMHGNEIEAFLLLLLHPPVATYQIGWTGPKGRQLSAHNLLLWEAANWLASQGYRRLDLGNVDTQNTPGLARFKIGSGAKIRPLGPTVLKIPRLRFRRHRQHAAA